jgi:hypothetical protein
MVHEVHVVDVRGIVHLHTVASSNKFKCRMSIYIPGMQNGVVRTPRPLTCFWCIAGRRFR